MSDNFIDHCDRQLKKLDQTIGNLQKHLPPALIVASQPVPLPPKDCPYCHEPMQPGDLLLRSDSGAFFALGIGYEVAWFEPKDGSKPTKVFQSSESRKAYRCPNCALIILPCWK